MKQVFRTAALAGAVILGLGLSCTAAAEGRPAQVIADLNAGQPHRAGELIVKYRDSASAAGRAAVLHGLDASRERVLRAGKRGRGETVLLRLPPGLQVAAAVRALSQDPAVEYAEPNWVYQHQASNDTYVASGDLWGMYGDASDPANAYGSQAAEAWAGGHTDCSNVIVGVIDEGIYYNHEDLTANIWTNPYDPVDGADNDGNGYVDDIHGWDFEGGSNDINSGGVGDDHGTHVSGTIAGTGNNGTGVAGVCWSGVKLISARFLGRRGGTTADAIEAVDYFNDLKARHGLNIVATNNSWGGGGYSQALSDAIARAGDAGILFIAAAGNDGVDNDTNDSYPSNYPHANIIAVASITSSGDLSSFSQWGATTVDIGAPGSGIISTVPARSKGALVSGYASYSGTSMATPHVTGAAALYASSHPGATAADIKAAILGTAIVTPSLQDKVVSDGRLDASGF